MISVRKGVFFKVVLLFNYFHLALSFLQTLDKICDFSQHAVHPYSGFKLFRNYEVRCSLPPVLHYVSLSHCDQGNLEYERITRTGKETDINWGQPICLVVPKSMRKRLDNKERRADRERFKTAKGENSTRKSLIPSVSLKDIPRRPHSVRTFLRTLITPNQETGIDKRSRKDSCDQNWRRFLRYFSGRLGFAEYHSPDVLNTDVDELEQVHYNQLTEDDVSNVQCYKFARRKRYALREATLFAPFTWVGGIFQCDTSLDDKRRYVQHIQNNDSDQPFNLNCDEESSVPVGPLIADRLDRQWRIRENTSKTTLKVPFLYTPALLDFRFGASGEKLGLKKASIIYKDHISKESTDNLDYDGWWKEININENYNYTESDIDLISTTMAKTVELIHEFEGNVQSSVFDDWILGAPALSGRDNTSIAHLEQKMFHLFYKLKNPETVTLFLKRIQSPWDDLRLSIG